MPPFVSPQITNLLEGHIDYRMSLIPRDESMVDLQTLLKRLVSALPQFTLIL